MSDAASNSFNQVLGQARCLAEPSDQLFALCNPVAALPAYSHHGVLLRRLPRL